MARSSKAGGAGFAPPPQPNRIPFKGTALLPARLAPARGVSVGYFQFQGKSEAIVLSLRSFLLRLAAVTAKMTLTPRRWSPAPSPREPSGAVAFCFLPSHPTRYTSGGHPRVLPKPRAHNATQRTRAGVPVEQPIPSIPRIPHPDPPGSPWRKAREALPG